MVRRTLLVDPSAQWLEQSRRAISDAVNLATFTDFLSARAELLKARPQFLATNLRLGAYNGLHLVHLVASQEIDARCLVFTDRPDQALIREAQQAGAFYEHASRVPHALSSYLHAALPNQDRRNAECLDRRQIRRGGRRAADALVLHAQDGDQYASRS